MHVWVWENLKRETERERERERYREGGKGEYVGKKRGLHNYIRRKLTENEGHNEVVISAIFIFSNSFPTTFDFLHPHQSLKCFPMYHQPDPALFK